MKLTDNLASIHEVMATMDQLQDPQFIQDNGVTEEELPLILEDLKKQLESYKSEIQWYLGYQLEKRQEHVIMSNGIWNQIKLLSERKSAEDKKIWNIDKRIDYLCKIAGIEKMKTPLWEISYTGGDKMKVIDTSVLPESLKNYTTGVILPRDIITFQALWYEIIESPVWLSIIKKRYKELSEEDKKICEWKIWIDQTKSLSVKQ